jgi:hypothetical protein
MMKVAEYYTARAAREALSQGKVAILAGGSGNPFFSTDTAAVLRALEINADALLMAKDIYRLALISQRQMTADELKAFLADSFKLLEML